jgi:hypothetical protein
MRRLVLLLALTGCTRSTPLLPLQGEMMPDGSVQPAAGGLTFAVFGDARPGNLNDTAKYPTAIVTGNFAQMQAKGAQFVVGTGDYMFADTDQAVTAQVDLLVQGEAGFTNGPIYHTMGNHECTGATASNCPAGTETANMRAFMTRLMPAGSTTPYYRIDVDTPHGKAKLVFVAANAWSDAQATWLQQQLADPTAYTFVVRHEPASITETPGVTPSEDLIKAAPLTLELLGHSHEYRVLDTQHVISGNGGAPIHSYFGNPASSGYGFLLIQQLDDGNFSISEVDEVSGNLTDTFKITADGRPAN